MANPTTTHVIEIETGIGEPAFIPLSMGNELQPISVGKKGMWRIESARVLDVHAFVYFDGSSLFLQSADEQNAASVDGYRVGKAWTELHAPCKIEIGMARLRYRSLIADADNQPTMMAPSPPVQAPPGGPGGAGPGGGSRPGASMPAGQGPQQNGPGPSQQPPHMATGQRPAAQMPSAPIAFPKADRPFKPGEFSAPPDDESTRIAPLDATGAGRVASGSHPRPAAGAPNDEDPSTRPEAARVVRGATGAVPAAQGSGQFGAMSPQQGVQAVQGMQGGMPSGGMMQPNMMQGPQGGMGYPQQPQQQGYPQQQGFPNPGSGAYGAMGPGGPQIPGPPGMPQGSLGPSMPPGGFGSMTPQGGMAQPAAEPQDLLSKIKKHATPKLIAGVLFIIGGIVYLVEDDEPVRPKKNPVVVVDGGVEAGAATTAAGGSATALPTAPPVMPLTASTPAWPAGVPCPPPNWPPNTPLPCTPNNIPNPPPDKPVTGGKDGGKDKDPKDKDPVRDAGAPLPAGTKTLERQAVDFVAAGDTAKAAAAYEELVRRDPNNKVYAEAARILRAKLDGGVQ